VGFQRLVEDKKALNDSIALVQGNSKSAATLPHVVKTQIREEKNKTKTLLLREKRKLHM
jgi:hypothetical protein